MFYSAHAMCCHKRPLFCSDQQLFVHRYCIVLYFTYTILFKCYDSILITTTTVANSSDTKQVSIETQQILSNIGIFISLVDGDIRLVSIVMTTKES